MGIQPISFCSSFFIRQGQTSDVDAKGLLKEILVADKARDFGVSVPEYRITASYETKGELANFQTNKIEEKHFKSLFKNLFLMDKNNLNHNDLDIGHVFYSDDGSVEFDCFRFSSPFIENSQKKYALPDFMMPTNQINYENASLGLYVNQIPDEKGKKEFLTSYLRASANYHANKADFVSKNIGIDYTQDMLNYEQVQAEVLQNPNEDMVNLMLLKLDFLSKQRLAFTEWDEGNGACGHPFSKERRLYSIPMYLDAVKSAIDYSNKAEELSSFKQGNEAKYYNYESKVGRFFADTYLSWVEGMADWNFVDDRVQPLNDSERQELSNSYKNIKNAGFSEKSTKIDEYLKLYKSKI